MLGWNWACFGVIHLHRQSPRRGVHVCGAPGLRSNRRNIQTEQVPLPHSLSVTHISVIAHTWAWQTHAEKSKHTQWSQLSLRCRSRVSPGLLTTAGRRPVPSRSPAERLQHCHSSLSAYDFLHALDDFHLNPLRLHGSTPSLLGPYCSFMRGRGFAPYWTECWDWYRRDMGGLLRQVSAYSVRNNSSQLENGERRVRDHNFSLPVEARHTQTGKRFGAFSPALITHTYTQSHGRICVLQWF